MSFPDFATADGWFAMGWDDYAATYNSLLHGAVASYRINMMCRYLEPILSNARMRENIYYAIGVEDAMLRGFEIKGSMPFCNRCVDSKMFSPPPPIRPCGYCGQAVQHGYLTTFGLIVDTVFCSEECIDNRLRSVINADISLCELYMMRNRKPVPIPEMPDEMARHFDLIPKVSVATDLTPPKRQPVKFPKMRKVNRNGQETQANEAAVS